MSDIILPNGYVFKTKQHISKVEDLLSTHTLTDGYKIDAKNLMYVIDNNSFDWGIYTLSNITSGVRFGIEGAAKGITSMSSSEDGISLIECIGTDLLISDLDISATGAGSEAIKMIGTSNEAIDLLNVSFSGSTAMGTLESLRQGFWTIGFAFGALSGFLLKGANWGGFRITSSRFINLSGALLKGDVGFSIGNIRSDVNIDVLAGQSAFAFDYDMILEDEGYQLENGRYSGDGNMVAPFTLGSGADTVETWKSRKAFFKGNKGNIAKNTKIGGYWSCTTEVLTPLTLNTSTKILGTTTYGFMQHLKSVGNNAFAHSTTKEESYAIDGSIVLEGTQSKDITLTIRKYDDSTATYSDLASFTRRIAGVAGPIDVATFRPFFPFVMLDENDRIELWITNITDSSDVTMLLGSNLALTAI